MVGGRIQEADQAVIADARVLARDEFRDDVEVLLHAHEYGLIPVERPLFIPATGLTHFPDAAQQNNIPVCSGPCPHAAKCVMVMPLASAL